MMKHPSKKILSLTLALTMTAAMFLTVALSGQSAVAEPVLPQAAEAVDTVAVNRVAVNSVAPAVQLPAEKTVTPVTGVPQGVLAAALNADKAAEAAAKAAAEAQKPTSDTSILYVGTTNSSDVRVRKSANTDSEILFNLASGTVVSVMSEKDGWYYMYYDGKCGYMSADYVDIRETASDLTGYGRVDADVLYMRSQPASDSEIVATLTKGEYVTMQGFENGWYAVSYDNYSGYMSGDYISPIAEKPAPKTETSAASSSASSSSSSYESYDSYDTYTAPAYSTAGNSIADFALQFLGTPYVYGGSSPSGFDCSGFTMYVFSQYGYSLPHGSASQMGCGYAVSRSDLQPGDLVFFYDPTYDYGGGGATHVGIYIGGGQFVHASSYNYGITVSSLSDPYYYAPCYCGARRIG